MSCHRTHNKSAKPVVRFCTSLLIVWMMMMQNGDAEYVDIDIDDDALLHLRIISIFQLDFIFEG